MANQNEPIGPLSSSLRGKGISPWVFLLLLVPALTIPFLKRKAPTADPSPLSEQFAPEMHLRNLDGDVRLLSSFRGQVVLVNFWASWCGPCMEEMPDLVELDRKLGNEKFAVLAVNVDETAAAVSNVPTSDLPRLVFYAVPDAELSPYDVSAIPTSYLVDAAGKIRATFLGPREWLSDGIISQIRSLLPK